MLSKRLEDILQKKIVNFDNVSGGCIAKTQRIDCDDGSSYFLKTGSSLGMFTMEANGLKEIANSKTLPVPELIASADDFLLLSYIKSNQRSSTFFEDFGQQYAQMHRYTSLHFGFYENNFIGNTSQQNLPTKDEANHWPTFYFNKRLKFQFLLAEQNGYLTADLRHLFSRLENKFDTILTEDGEQPCLLHGDLWGGNYMVDSVGNAMLIDPAVYYGHREADLAMTKIFGGFAPVFYEAYQASYPLKEGWEYRENIYKLYHLLNHLNLFGSSYYSEVLSLINSYVK